MGVTVGVTIIVSSVISVSSTVLFFNIKITAVGISIHVISIIKKQKIPVVIFST